MLKRLLLMSLLGQVFTLMIADYNPDPAAELAEGGAELARAGRGADPDNDSCTCARAPNPINLNEKWGKKKLDRLLKWITSLIGSLKENETEGPVVVMPVLIDESFMKAVVDEVQELPEDSAAVDEVQEFPQGREIVVEVTEATTQPPPPTETTVAPTDTTLSTSPEPKDPLVVCNLPRDKGPCKAIRRQWFYNATVSDCTMFIYGGCGGNDNRFHSKDECMTFCKDVGPVITT